jgi:DNA processing protein
MAGMCEATILIEAGAKSGTLITARMAVDYNRELLVVPGSIFSPNSYGTHQFLKLGATPVTEAEDIISVLNLERKVGEASPRPPKETLSPETILILTHLAEPTAKDALVHLLERPINEANIILMQAELEGHICQNNGIYTALSSLTANTTPPTLFDRKQKN